MMKSTIEWHSVDEMLPDLSKLMPGEHEYVLVRIQYPELVAGISPGADITICGYEYFGDGEAYWDGDDSFGFIDPDLITHWAYLPNAEEGFEGLQ